MVNSSTVKFKPVSISPIGIIEGNNQTLELIVSQLQNEYLKFRVEENIQPIIWTKAIINCVFNSICPLLETDNGIFYRNTYALDIAKRILSDCISLAQKVGINLEVDEVTKTLLMISKSSDGQLISTYQDLNNKRKTEIDSLNFALVDIASRLKMDDLVKEVRLLGELIKLKSVLSLND